VFALSAGLRSVTPVVLVNGMAKALGEGGTRGPVPDPPPLLGSGRDDTPPRRWFPPRSLSLTNWLATKQWTPAHLLRVLGDHHFKCGDDDDGYSVKVHWRAVVLVGTISIVQRGF